MYSQVDYLSKPVTMAGFTFFLVAPIFYYKLTTKALMVRIQPRSL